MCSEYVLQSGTTNEEMRVHCTKLFSTLKIWKCTCENQKCHFTEKNS